MPAASKVRLKEALERLVRFYGDFGQPEKAVEWKQKLTDFNDAPKP